MPTLLYYRLTNKRREREMTFDTWTEYTAYLKSLPTDACIAALCDHNIKCLEIEEYDREFSLLDKEATE
jgi:predicted nucleic acid-binding protein